MTESPRHANSVSRITKLVEPERGVVLSNTDNGGKNGYQLPPIVCPDGKARAFVIDCAVRLKSGVMVAFEVDLNHETTKVKLAMLRAFGWVPIQASPEDVDAWVKDSSLLDDEIAYRIRETGKLLEVIKIKQ